MKKLYFLTILTCLITISCNQEEDYNNRVFKNYLSSQIELASKKLDETVEGVNEGEYKLGSKEIYSKLILEAEAIYKNNNSKQSEIDLATEKLLKAKDDYFDQMVPFTSSLVAQLNQARILYDNTKEGESEGNVSVGSKAVFLAAINKAQAFLDAGGYTQTELDVVISSFTDAIFAYEAKIIGAYNVPIENSSFELPGSETMDFDLIPGWSFQGNRFNWSQYYATQVGTKKSGVGLLPTTTDADYAIVIGNYTNGVWQRLQETVHPGAIYSLTFDASLRSSPKDWQGIAYETHVLSRLIAFNGTEGDISDITIIEQKSSSLGADENRNDFINISHVYQIPQDQSLITKKLGIQFRTYEEGFDFEKEVWSESETSELWSETWIYIDNVILKRAYN